MRILFVLPGLVPPAEDPRRDKLFHLSEIASGEALLPVWWASTSGVSPFLAGEFPIYRVGAFRYHLQLAYRWPRPLRKLASFLFYLRRGRQLHREKPFDLIVTYGVNTTGVAALLLKWITGAKLVLEIPGVPEHAFYFDSPHRGRAAKLKHAFSNRLLRLVGGHADCLKLLYPEQVAAYPGLRRKPAAVFHDFVPLSLVPQGSNPEPFVLSVGYPWFTKGMDVLIRAFRRIASDFPAWRLKLLGYFPDRKVLEVAAGDCAQIELLYPLPNPVALDQIARCSVFALASRTEAMGRVLLEAMAARKPIVASRIGGIPHYIREGANGLLFASGNERELAERLAELLTSDDLRHRLANQAYATAFANYDERAYVLAFRRMIDALAPDRPAAVPGHDGANAAPFSAVGGKTRP